MRIDPWLGLKTLQPLGSPNRLRKVGEYTRPRVWESLGADDVQSTRRVAT